jgi:hypothetical protein
MNGLVWATFPRAKRALHARQHRALAARVAERTERLPQTRSREQDALALFDEGGLVVARHSANEESTCVFGHAVYALAATEPHAVQRLTVRTAYVAIGGFGEDLLDAVDRAVAVALDGGAFAHPDELPRTWLRELIAE